MSIFITRTATARRARPVREVTSSRIGECTALRSSAKHWNKMMRRDAKICKIFTCLAKF